MIMQPIQEDDTYETSQPKIVEKSLPEQWRLVKLGDVLREVDVRAEDLKVVESEHLPVLSLTKNKGLIPQSERFNNRVATQDISNYKVIKKGQIVYNPFVLWEGAIYALKGREQGLVSPSYLVWEATHANNYFLDFLLRTPQLLNEYLRVASGVVQRRRAVRKDVFLNIRIPLPPQSEQNAIVQVLQAIQDTIQVRQRESELEHERKVTLMGRLFTYGTRGEPLRHTEIGEIPQSWNVVRMGKMARIERGKFAHRPRNDPDFYGGDIPFIQTGDVTASNGYIRTYTQTLSEKGLAVSKVFPKGTIVITIAANIGYTGILEFDSAFPDSLIGITPIAPTSVDYPYLNYYLSTQQSEMDRKAPQGTQKNINIEFLSPWPILIPPLEEQIEIVNVLSACDKKITALEQELILLEELFRAFLYELMSGRLSTLPLIEEGDTHD